MKARTTLLFLLVLVLLGCKSLSQNLTKAETSALRQGWDIINADGKFIFSIPQNMQKQDTPGIDSYVEEYRNTNMKVSFDYGIYSDPLDGYSMEPEYKYCAGVHFPAVNEDGSKLTLMVEFNDEKDYETAKTIFRSIYFE